MIDSMCVIIRRPRGEEQTLLGLRASWATLSASMDTKMVFMDDGVYNLLSRTGYIGETIEEFIAAEGEAYCLIESLQERGLSEQDLIEGISIVPEEALSKIVEECESLAVF